MAGIHSQGLPAPNAFSSSALPLFTGSESLVMDTGLPNGINPQSAAFTSKQVSAIGHGGNTNLVDAATTTADLRVGSQFTWVIGATGRTFTMSNASPGQVVILNLKQDATGSRTVTTWTNVLWASGTAPTLTTTAAALDVLRFTYNDALGKFIGETVGKAMA